MNKTITNKKKFVISSLTMNKHQFRFVENFINVLLKNFKNYEIILLVSKKGLIKKNKRIKEIEFPKYKNSIIYKIYLFYFKLKKISKKINSDIWFSYDSLTPNVYSKKLFSYFHTPSPFIKSKLPNIKNDFIFKMKGKIYNFFIKLLIKNNTSIIVQSSWLKKEFIKRYKVKNLIIAPLDYVESPRKGTINKKFKKFFYPSYPYIYKNFELLGESAKILDKNKNWNGKIIITIDINQNNYSKSFYNNYKKYKSLKFTGYQSHKNIINIYKHSDALIFPSLVETWGLPLSEAKRYNLAIIASNLDYAKESTGTYHTATFFNPKDPYELANTLLKANLGNKIFKKTYFKNPDRNYAQNNYELIKLMISK